MSLLVDVAATSRLTRLVVSDVLTVRPRRWALQRLPIGSVGAPGPGWVLTCERCAAVWAALVVLGARRTRAGRAVVRGLAVAELAGLLATR